MKTFLKKFHKNKRLIFLLIYFPIFISMQVPSKNNVPSPSVGGTCFQREPHFSSRLLVFQLLISFFFSIFSSYTSFFNFIPHFFCLNNFFVLVYLMTNVRGDSGLSVLAERRTIRVSLLQRLALSQWSLRFLTTLMNLISPFFLNLHLHLLFYIYTQFFYSYLHCQPIDCVDLEATSISLRHDLFLWIFYSALCFNKSLLL